MGITVPPQNWTVVEITVDEKVDDIRAICRELFITPLNEAMTKAALLRHNVKNVVHSKDFRFEMEVGSKKEKREPDECPIFARCVGSDDPCFFKLGILSKLRV